MPSRFNCEKCYYKCSKKSSWGQHLMTAKHQKANQKLINANEIFFCDFCNTTFKHQSSFCRHKKKCQIKYIENTVEPINFIEKTMEPINIIEDKDTLLLQLLKQNGELQKSLIELSKEKTITNNNTNSNNKTFNLNIFLNETCKDALNIHEFISSIKVSLDDLENTGRRGYIEGISNIIVNKLNNLEEYKRPIHCSDFKREILYIKDDNQWIKENDNKPVLTKAIKEIANENIKKIKEWRELNPDCTKVDSKKNNLYLKIVSNSMNGSTQEESNKNINKIISNVAKEVVINK